MSTISVILPTIGRSTLGAAVDSIAKNLKGGDELIIVPDIPPSGEWGTEQYDHGIDMANGFWLMFMTDDDIMEPGALEAVRKGAGAFPEIGVHVFRMRMEHWDGRILGWDDRPGTVGAQQIVVRNEKDSVYFPSWSADKSALNDHAFLKACLKYYKLSCPMYHDEIVCTMRAHNEGRML